MRRPCPRLTPRSFVHYTFIYFPIFYIFKETIQGEPNQNGAALCETALGKYRHNFVEDNLKMWSLWIPGDIIVYAVPLWMRLPLNHGFSFVWTCYLSFLRGGPSSEDEAAASDRPSRGAGKLPWTASGVSVREALGSPPADGAQQS